MIRFQILNFDFQYTLYLVSTKVLSLNVKSSAFLLTCERKIILLYCFSCTVILVVDGSVDDVDTVVDNVSSG